MKLVKLLTKAYLSVANTYPIDEELQKLLCECLIKAQEKLTSTQKEQYLKWHKKHWPFLDW